MLSYHKLIVNFFLCCCFLWIGWDKERNVPWGYKIYIEREKNGWKSIEKAFIQSLKMDSTLHTNINCKGARIWKNSSVFRTCSPVFLVSFADNHWFYKQSPPKNCSCDTLHLMQVCLDLWPISRWYGLYKNRLSNPFLFKKPSPTTSSL